MRSTKPAVRCVAEIRSYDLLVGPRDRVANLDAGQSPTHVTVDGEVFDVSRSTEHPGQHVFACLSGPNKGYGFGTKRSDGAAMSEREIGASIRDF